MLAVALVVLCATVAVVLSVAGGAVSFHAYAGPQLPASTVASTIVAQSGQRVSEVRCHDDLPGTVGASIVCDATVDGVPTAMRVTTTAVEGEHILFDYATVPPTQPT